MAMRLQTDSGLNGGLFLRDQVTRTIPRAPEGIALVIEVGAFHFNAPKNLSVFDKVRLSLKTSQYPDEGETLVEVELEDTEYDDALISVTGWNAGTEKNLTFELDAAEMAYALGELTEASMWMVLSGHTESTGNWVTLGAGFFVLVESNSEPGTVVGLVRYDVPQTLTTGEKNQVKSNIGLSSAADLPYTPASNANWTGAADPGNTNHALDQLASRAKALEDEADPTVDLHSATYTPTTLSDWNSGTDPGSAGQGMDQLAARTKTLETAVPDAANVSYTPASNANWAGATDPGNTNAALDQLASRSKALEDEADPTVDLHSTTYTPAVLANWDGSSDPGSAGQGMDQLAARTKTLETTNPDASNTTYTPASAADWNSATDPGNTNAALDQLASRAKTLETAYAYTPTTAADWNSAADPGTMGQALDQLAERAKDLEVAFDGLATVANSGDYIDLSNTPTLGALADNDTINNGDWSGTDLSVANGGTGASDASGARTNLGLGTAAVLDVGTTANSVVQLNGSGQLPAVDGSLLTGLAGAPSLFSPETGPSAGDAVNGMVQGPSFPSVGFLRPANSFSAVDLASSNDTTGDLSAERVDVGTYHTPVNYSSAGTALDDHIAGIDTALASVGDDQEADEVPYTAETPANWPGEVSPDNVAEALDIAGQHITSPHVQAEDLVATNIGFTPATALNWGTSPSLVSQGLDELADRVVDLEGVSAGDVVGPSSVTDSRPALFDGTTGKLLKEASAALATVALTGAYSDLSGKPTLGDLADQNTVNNGDWSGTDLAVVNGGTGASDASGARTNLGLVIGTDVPAFHANLAALAGLTGAANKGFSFTGAGAMSLFDLTAAGLALLAGANAAAQLATLGAAAASAIKLVQIKSTSNNTETSDTTNIPYDDTIPQSGEGTEIVTLGITPVSTGNYLHFTFCANLSCSARQNLVIALFKDSDTDATFATAVTVSSATDMVPLTWKCAVAAPSTSAQTWKIRVGRATSSGTWYVGRSSSGAAFSTVNHTLFTIEEKTHS